MAVEASRAIVGGNIGQKANWQRPSQWPWWLFGAIGLGFYLVFLLFGLPVKQSCRRTVCVTGRWAGVDNAWEQRKLDPEKCLKMPQNPTCPVHAVLGGSLALMSRRCRCS